MEEILILVKKTGSKGGYRDAVYKSGYGAKTQETFAATPDAALKQLAELIANPNARGEERAAHITPQE